MEAVPRSELDRESQSAIREKWGSSLEAGFLVIPTVMIHAQKKLGLDTTDLVVLLNLVSHWWTKDQHPFVSTTTIAKRMDVDKRTVERHIKKLEEKGLLKRPKSQSSDSSTSEKAYNRCFDLSPLGEKLAFQSKAALVTRAIQAEYPRS